MNKDYLFLGAEFQAIPDATNYIIDPTPPGNYKVQASIDNWLEEARNKLMAEADTRLLTGSVSKCALIYADGSKAVPSSDSNSIYSFLDELARDESMETTYVFGYNIKRTLAIMALNGVLSNDVVTGFGFGSKSSRVVGIDPIHNVFDINAKDYETYKAMLLRRLGYNAAPSLSAIAQAKEVALIVDRLRL